VERSGPGFDPLRSALQLPLQRPHERDQVGFLLWRQLQLEDQVEKLYRIFESQKPAVVHVRRRFFDPTERKVLMGPSADAIMPLIRCGL
jgi:hypothetical protein